MQQKSLVCNSIICYSIISKFFYLNYDIQYIKHLPHIILKKYKFRGVGVNYHAGKDICQSEV